jgi:hypothetical protein
MPEGIPGRHNGIKEDLQRIADETGNTYDTCRIWRETGKAWPPARRQAAVDKGVPFSVFVELRHTKNPGKLEGLTAAKARERARAKGKGTGKGSQPREPKFKNTRDLVEEVRMGLAQALRADDPLAQSAQILLEADDMLDIHFKLIEDMLTGLRDRANELLGKFEQRHAEFLEREKEAEVAEEATATEREGEHIDFLSATAKGVSKAKSKASRPSGQHLKKGRAVEQ